MSTHQYPDDLSDAEWAILAPLIPPAKSGAHGGKTRTTNIRAVLNAIFYRLRTGCGWHHLPHDYPPWGPPRPIGMPGRPTAPGNASMTSCAVTSARPSGGRPPQCGLLGSPERQNDAQRGPAGYDGGKQVKGRQRHILVDTEGFLLGVVVTAANGGERAGAKLVLATVGTPSPRLQRIWMDGGDTGPFVDWVQQTSGWVVDITLPPTDQKGCVVVARRWVVERTFSWFGQYRLLSKEYEPTVERSTADISVAMTHLMLRRLARLQARQRLTASDHYKTG